MSRHPVRSRHGAGCLVQCTVFCTVQVPVHKVSKKKKYKIFKNFIVGDLIYKIFIWQLL